MSCEINTILTGDTTPILCPPFLTGGTVTIPWSTILYSGVTFQNDGTLLFNNLPIGRKCCYNFHLSNINSGQLPNTLLNGDGVYSGYTTYWSDQNEYNEIFTNDFDENLYFNGNCYWGKRTDECSYIQLSETPNSLIVLTGGTNGKISMWVKVLEPTECDGQGIGSFTITNDCGITEVVQCEGYVPMLEVPSNITVPENEVYFKFTDGSIPLSQPNLTPECCAGWGYGWLNGKCRTDKTPGRINKPVNFSITTDSQFINSKLTGVTVYDSNVNGFGEWVKLESNIGDITQEVDFKIILKSCGLEDCCDYDIFIDEIQVTTDVLDTFDVFDTLKCPGFDLTKVVDNKKSWVWSDTTTNRQFAPSEDADLKWRYTDYKGINGVYENHSDLVVNSKEFNVTFNLLKPSGSTMSQVIEYKKIFQSFWVQFIEQFVPASTIFVSGERWSNINNISICEVDTCGYETSTTNNIVTDLPIISCENIGNIITQVLNNPTLLDTYGVTLEQLDNFSNSCRVSTGLLEPIDDKILLNDEIIKDSPLLSLMDNSNSLLLQVAMLDTNFYENREAGVFIHQIRDNNISSLSVLEPTSLVNTTILQTERIITEIR